MVGAIEAGRAILDGVARERQGRRAVGESGGPAAELAREWPGGQEHPSVPGSEGSWSERGSYMK